MPEGQLTQVEKQIVEEPGLRAEAHLFRKSGQGRARRY
jgi:hypothetical protein